MSYTQTEELYAKIYYSKKDRDFFLTLRETAY